MNEWIRAAVQAFAAFEQWLVEGHHALHVIGALFCAWLYLFGRRRLAERRRRRRPAPLSPEELGRALFRAARTEDLSGYRELFLDPEEAALVLGDDVRAYMKARSRGTLRASLDGLVAEIPADAVFVGMKNRGLDHWALRITDGRGEIRLVDAGILVAVGNVWRVFGPSRGDKGRRSASVIPQV